MKKLIVLLLVAGVISLGFTSNLFAQSAVNDTIKTEVAEQAKNLETLAEKEKLIKTLSPLGELESHNVIINLKRENTLIGLYGIKKNFIRNDYNTL